MLQGAKPNNEVLYIGIGYYKTPNQLDGTAHDIKDMGQIFENGEYKSTYLTDDKKLKMPANGLPNKNTIVSSIQNMLKSAKPGDTKVIYYSGHGTQVRVNGKVHDYLVPLDAVKDGFNQNNLISDDELHNLTTQVPEGVKLLIVADSCFSGKIAELDHNVRSLAGASNVKSFHLLKTAAEKIEKDAKKVLKKFEVIPFARLAAKFEKSNSKALENGHGDVSLIAGCKATQESTDLGTNGALTAALKQYISDNKLSSFMNTCFDYITKGLHNIKVYVTGWIKKAGIKTQDPQISYSEDTSRTHTQVLVPRRSGVLHSFNKLLKGAKPESSANVALLEPTGSRSSLRASN